MLSYSEAQTNCVKPMDEGYNAVSLCTAILDLKCGEIISFKHLFYSFFYMI